MQQPSCPAVMEFLGFYEIATAFLDVHVNGLDTPRKTAARVAADCCGGRGRRLVVVASRVRGILHACPLRCVTLMWFGHRVLVFDLWFLVLFVCSKSS